MQQDPSAFLLTSEAARLAGVSSETIRSWARGGRLPALMTPTGVRLFAREDVDRLDRNGRPRKYEFPWRSRQVLDVPPAVRAKLGDPHTALWITEGARKADAAVSVGLTCISVSGVWNWRGTNTTGGKTALPDWEL